MFSSSYSSKLKLKILLETRVVSNTLCWWNLNHVRVVTSKGLPLIDQISHASKQWRCLNNTNWSQILTSSFSETLYISQLQRLPVSTHPAQSYNRNRSLSKYKIPPTISFNVRYNMAAIQGGRNMKRDSSEASLLLSSSHSREDMEEFLKAYESEWDL